VTPDGPEAGDQILEMLGLRATGVPDLDDIPSATHWPSLTKDKAELEWRELRDWVEHLQQRFSHLDHHAIPPCWWQHNEQVEALAALRDHERVSYLPAAPATAPVEWMRALRDIETLLRSWAAEYPCGAAHKEPPARQPLPAPAGAPAPRRPDHVVEGTLDALAIACAAVKTRSSSTSARLPNRDANCPPSSSTPSFGAFRASW
jgi:hypothetical protein